ncbi:MAG: copper chaperone PCu(A)C [Pseudomonadota bacterium]
MKLATSTIIAALVAPTLAFASDLEVVDAWSPVAPPAAKIHAVYLTLSNEGDAPRSLVGVSSELHKMAHLHESREKDGVATMAMLAQIDIPPGESLEMKAGGMHVMLMGASAGLAAGETIPLTLSFANGETLSVSAAVKSRNADG